MSEAQFVSGFGGYLAVGSGIGVSVVQHNSRYGFIFSYIIDDVTTSGAPGFTQGLPIIADFESGEMTTPEDSTAYPEAIGLVPGTVLTIWFKRGNSEIYDLLEDTIVQTYKPDNDQKKARVITITFKFGTLTLNGGSPDLG
jgi:hypothetical protein